MPATAHADSTEDIRSRILAAASQRFAQFGYNKTTMAEIAQDCDMSAANLYRFFKNKLDIGANLACGCLDTKLLLTEEIIHQDRAAADRLHDVVLHVLHYTHGQWSEDPRINELVTAICDTRLDIVNRYKLSEHQLLVTLLEDGVRRGEFAISDIEDTATAIATAITAFGLPLIMPLYDIEVFEQRAQSVVRLMLNGLLKP